MACALKRAIERNAQLKMKERAGWTQSSLPNERAAFQALDARTAPQVGMLMAPYYPCLFTLTKEPSVTVRHDGGKVLCGVAELVSRPGCSVVSIGSNWDRSFEDGVDALAGPGRCSVDIFDPTMNGTTAGGAGSQRLQRWVARLPPNYRFHDVGVHGGGAGAAAARRQFRRKATTTLPALLTGLGRASVDVLKFDIEGFEYELLEATDWTAVKAGLLVFELHINLFVERRGVQGYTWPRLERHLARIEAAGYRLYSLEPVAAHVWSRVFNGQGQAELAFIHRDWEPSTGRFDGGGCRVASS